VNADAILTRLTEIARLIESHRAALYLLDLERLELQTRLRGSDWRPPELTP
jgi:hypothetical protein